MRLEQPSANSWSNAGRLPAAGMTILEVLLALLVLVVALAGIGSLTTMGRQSGADARDLTMGQLLCEGKMAEISSGVSPANSTSGIFQEDPDWIFSVQAAPADTPGLLSVRVTVTQNPQTYDQPMEFVLVRWVPDPDYAAELAQ
jgi:Tfp pilus assembly protein PilV